MKTANIFFIFIISMSLLLILFYCDIEPKTDSIATPTATLTSEVSSLCTKYSVCPSSCPDGSFCSVFDNYFYYGCFFLVELNNTTEIKESFTSLIDSINYFWVTLVNQMEAETFDTSIVINDFNEVIKDENILALSIMLKEIIGDYNMGSNQADFTCNDFINFVNGSIIPFIDGIDCTEDPTLSDTLLNDPVNNDLWDSLSGMIGLVGLNELQLCELLNEDIPAINDIFNLSDISNNISSTGCNEPYIDYHYNSYIGATPTNFEHYLNYISDGGLEQTDDEWNILLESLIKNELKNSFAIIANICKYIHDYSDYLNVIAIFPSLFIYWPDYVPDCYLY